MKTIRDFWLRWYAFLPIILVVLIFLIHDLLRSYTREVEFAQRNNENIARVLDGHLSSSIDKIDITLSAAVAELGNNLAQTNLNENNQKLAKFLEKIPESQSLRIANADGEFIFDASGQVHPTNIADRDYFLISKNDPYAGLVISKPIHARITNNWVITISRQFRDQQGKFLGIIQAAIKADYFIRFYESLNLGQEGLVALFSDDSVLFARQPNIPEKLGIKIDDIHLKLFKQKNHNEEHFHFISPLDGIERIAYARKASSGYPFIFVVAVSNNQVLIELGWKAVVYFLLTALLLIAYYYIISNWHRRHDYALKIAEQMTSVIQEQTNRLSSIIDATQVGTWEWNVQTGEVIFNERWAAMIGFQLTELAPISIDTWLSHTHPDDLELSAELLEQHFSGESSYYECELRMWHKDSYWVWILDRGQVTSWTNSGQPLWMFGTHQDISATKALEFSLKNLLEDHERLVQNIPVGVFRYYVNRKNNDIRLSYVSPRWCEQLEATEEDAKLNANIAFDKIHLEDREDFNKKFKIACDECLPFTWEGRLQLKQGIKWIRIEATVSVLPNSDLIWNGIQSDITLEIESRQAEQRANALQKALLDNSAVGIFLTTWDRKIEQISHRACELFGYSAEELLGKTAEIIHVDTEHYQSFANNYTHLNGKRLVDLEFPFRHRDGHIFWCAISGTPLDLADRNKGVIWTFLNIDERRHLAEEVDRQRRTLSDILNSIPAAVSYWNAQDVHNIYNVFSNRTYAEWYATTPEALVGIHVRDLIGDELYQANWHRMAAARLGETLVYDRLQPYISNQPQRYAQVHYIPDLCDGKPNGIYVMMFDTTNIKKSELEMKQAKELAEEAVQAKGRFLANMSHEIRTPMNAVLGFLDLLNRTALDQQQTDYAQKAQIAAQTLLDLINNILDFSKVEAGKLELEHSEFSVSDLLNKLSIILSSSAKNKPIEILFDIDTDIPNYLYGDSLRLQQILLNLAGNSVKFTETGEITISMKLVKKSTEQAHIDFSVQDSGIGIPEDKIAYIFEGFTQAELSTSRRYGGTGLGLAISQHLVQLMGGQLNVNSTLGKGSCFYFSLTFNYKNSEPILSQHKSNPALNLIIIDNSPSSKRILQNITDALNCKATILSSLTETLPLLRNTTQLYDVLLLDWESINIYDLEAIEKLYDFIIKCNMLLIIMLTVEFKELSITYNNKLNELARGFLIKPITPRSFTNTIYEAFSSGEKLGNSHTKASQRLLGLSLLLVEDNLANQQVAFEILNLEGASVTIANNGLDAINLIHNESKKFDAVLTDIQMPEMDGYETSRQLRLEFSRDQLPIIAMTANAMPADREKCFAAGMNDYITKPIIIDQMIDVILNCCAQSDRAYQDHLLLNQKDINLKNHENIDLSSALSRLNNNELIYARLANSFCVDYSSIGLRLNQLWQAQDITQLSRLLHTLKGLSATLGANSLAELAANAENTIKEKINDEQGKQIFNELNNLTKKTISQLRKITNSIMENKKPEKTKNNLNKQQIIDLIHWLDYLLSEYNMDALEAFSFLKQQTILSNELSDLEETMRQLNFSDARIHLNKLINFVDSKYPDISD